LIWAQLSSTHSLEPSYGSTTCNEVKLTPPASFHAAKHWLQVLAGPEPNWWHAIIQSEFVVQGIPYITHPLCHVLVPHAGQKFVVHLLSDQPSQFSIYDAAYPFGQRQSDFLAVDIYYDASPCLINLTLFEGRQQPA